MLYSAKHLDGSTLHASDGEIGKVRELYFDDARWVIRHVVVQTGGWLSGRRVLISPHAVRAVRPEAHRVDVALTLQQVRDAPAVDSERPVSRQDEIAAYDFYRYPYYWGGTGLWGAIDLPLGGAVAPFAAPIPEDGPAQDAERAWRQAERDAADPHLRSSAEVIGYHVAARDGDIGHIDDFLFDAQSWRIAMVVVDTRNWLPDRLVLVPPTWLRQVDWAEQRVGFRVTRESIRSSPRYERQPTLGDESVRAVQRHFESSE